MHFLSAGKQPLSVVWPVVYFGIVQFMILIPIGWLLVLLLRMRRSLGPMMGLGTAYANVGFFGIPVTQLAFGPDYLIPFPFDPRALLWVAPAVAWAAVASGVAREFCEMEEYRQQLEARLGKARGLMRGIINRASKNPKRIVFPEGEDLKVIPTTDTIT